MSLDRPGPGHGDALGDRAHLCTIAVSWPSAMRLVETVRAHDPTRSISVLSLAERDPALTARLDADVLPVSALSIDPEELAELQLIYSTEELAGALVPRLLVTLLQGPAARGVIYLADSFEVHTPLDVLDDALEGRTTLLWRRATQPLPDDDLEPSDRTLLLEGNVHPGHIAVSQGSTPFLDWWAQRTRWDANVDPCSGLWGAGRWLDLATDLFDVEPLSGHGCAISATNLHENRLEGSPGGFTAAGAALCTFDATGFDDGHPSHNRGASRAQVMTADHPGLAALLDRRAGGLAQIEGSGAPSASAQRFDPLVRGMARAELRGARRDGRPPGFRAGTPEEADFVRWLSEPVAHPGAPISRLLHAVAVTRPDLRIHFPHPLAGDGPGLAAWAADEHDFGRTYGALQIPAPASDRRVAAASPGFNIVGYLHGELGLGEAGRLMVRAAARAGVPFVPIGFSETASRQSVAFGPTVDRAPHETTLLCVNADLTPLASARTWGALDPDRHRIGYWFWEVDRFPADQAASTFYVDELWAASGYVADVLRATTDKPVRVIPHPVPEPVPTHLTREDLGLTDRFTFAFWFDCFSGVDRKNPAGLVEAFCRAFTPDEGPMLLLKAINGHHDPSEMRRLHDLAGERPDITILDEYWTGTQMRALVQRIDCYVSLHRSEGFGQTMADAMAAATPVIATAHSGNLEYMTDENSHLVPAELVSVGPGRPPYPSEASWAAPDIEVAAALMRGVVEHPGDAAAKAAVALADIRRRHGLEVTAALLRGELERRLAA